MRVVNYGWLIRYLQSKIASLFLSTMLGDSDQDVLPNSSVAVTLPPYPLLR